MKMQNKLFIKQKYLKNLDMDIYQIVWALSAQVPKGFVTTYGAIAKALGDIRASRAVGKIEHVNPTPIIVPCHRVVYSNGGIGGFGAPEGIAKKIELLASEGVRVKGGKVVDFNNVLFEDFEISKPGPLEILRKEQQGLRKEVKLEDHKPFEDINTIGGIDVSYTADTAFGAVVVLDLNTANLVEQQVTREKIRFPYIPTYLSYHELPIAIKLLEKLSKIPDIILFDGNGVLHPLNMGLATHAGIIFQQPTLGIAKKLLIGELGKPLRGSLGVREIKYGNQIIGYGLKPKNAKKKLVYVSPGNNVCFNSALRIAQKICIHRMPEPIRAAHELARKLRISAIGFNVEPPQN